MSQLIKTIGGQVLIEFDRGTFDNWCVYLTRRNQERYAPRDTEYFLIVKKKAHLYGKQLLYDDFVAIYNRTTRTVDADVLILITDISKKYGKDAEEMDIWFTVLYAGMIAEENKENAILKKRIKRLGIYQILMEDYEPVIAANFSKGKNWKELDLVMKQKGF